MKYKVKEGLTKEMFTKTKWNVSQWTIEQKTLWQKEMFKLGYTWTGGHCVVKRLFPLYYYYLGESLDMLFTDKEDNMDLFFEYDENCQKYFTDVFDIVEEEETSTDDVLIINKDLVPHTHSGSATTTTEPEELPQMTSEPVESKTVWTDTHYDQNYTLTEEDIENGYVRLDAYTVAKVWRIGSKDDSGALWHTFKVFPRYGEKNDKAREIKAMYAQIKALAKIEGVKLD